VIEVKNVTKKYGNFTAVKDVSFTVNDGEIVGFLGPNGAGKSTTMNMITGYIEPTEGTVIINGYDILKKPLKAKKQIGYMPEGVPLYYDLTVKEFVTYMAELKKVDKKEKKNEVEKAINETGLKDVEKKLIRNLSRGYKQRVSMAGALVGNPDVLILDEPTVGLDPKQITEIRNLIKDLGKEHTVILSSHILSEVSQICKKVIIINKGEIVAIDTPEHLEEQTKEKDIIILTVEDKEENMKKIKTILPELKSCKEIKDNNDGTKQYMLEANENVDLRKKLFEVLPKYNVTIFELKKAETSLEDAFLSLIDKNTKAKKEVENKDVENHNDKKKKSWMEKTKNKSEKKGGKK
jgi:ABC-2 type transport system ATP-binding protein